MDLDIKLSIPAIIFKDIAKSIRHTHKSFHTKAHPISKECSILVVKNNKIKYTIKMQSGDIILWDAINNIVNNSSTKYWFKKYKIPSNIANTMTEYVLSVVTEPQMCIVKKPTGVNIKEPGSIQMITQWIYDILPSN